MMDADSKARELLLTANRLDKCAAFIAQQAEGQLVPDEVKRGLASMHESSAFIRQCGKHMLSAPCQIWND